MEYFSFITVNSKILICHNHGIIITFRTFFYLHDLNKNCYGDIRNWANDHSFSHIFTCEQLLNVMGICILYRQVGNMTLFVSYAVVNWFYKLTPLYSCASKVNLRYRKQRAYRQYRFQLKVIYIVRNPVKTKHLNRKYS